MRHVPLEPPDVGVHDHKGYPATVWLWLGLACLLTLFTLGRWTVPIAAWLAPVFLVRFLRLTRPRHGAVWGALGYAGAYLVGWLGVLPFAGTMYVMMVLAVGLLLFLPFLIDRLIRPYLPGFWSTLTLPLAWVAVEFLFSRVGLGTWGMLANTQYGNLPLLQLLAVTGLWGITFLVGWFAAVVNWAWEQEFNWPVIRGGVCLYSGLLALVLLAGGLRLALFPVTGRTVLVASISVANMEAFMKTWLPLRMGQSRQLPDEQAAQDTTRALHASLFSESERAARAGAKLIFWSETNALVLKADEPELLAQGQRFAAAQQVYLFMSLATITPGQELVENKVVGIDPAGKILATYLKTHPVPGEGSVPGDGLLPVVQTPYGKVAWAICYDFDYPELIRQAGRAGVDIMLDPSEDSRGMDPIHSRMATMRALEFGFSLVRQTHNGLSLAVDHQGHVLAALDDAGDTPSHVMFTQVPAQAGVATLYTRVGDALAWLCMVGLLTLVAYGIVRARGATAPVT